MNISLLLRRVGISLGLATAMYATAPQSVSGFVYYDTVSIASGVRFQINQGLLLQTDGTLFGLFSQSSPTSGGTSTPNGGKWNYRKVTETDGELTLIYPTHQQRRTLRFFTDVSGIILASSLIIPELSGSFRIAPMEVRSSLVNCSNRSFVRGGGNTYSGFVISGELPRTVLVRAVGPGLSAFGITDALENPKLTVSKDEIPISQNDDWDSQGDGESIRRVSAFVGAFPLTASSKDSALVVTLAPGAYVAQARAVDPEGSGQIIVEVYILP